MAAGLALALHASAAVTTIGYARFWTRQATTAPAVVPVTMEWLAAAPDVSDKTDISDKSEEQARVAARPPEVEPPPPVPVKQEATVAVPPPPAVVESDKSDEPSCETAPLPEKQMATALPAVAVPVAAAEPASRASGALPSAAPGTEMQNSAAAGPYPVALADIRPRYPRSARLQGKEGRVVVWAVIDATGHSERLEVRESSGQPTLDEAALDAVNRAHFRPATRDGVPVAGEIRLPFEFRLK